MCTDSTLFVVAGCRFLGCIIYQVLTFKRKFYNYNYSTKTLQINVILWLNPNHFNFTEKVNRKPTSKAQKIFQIGSIFLFIVFACQGVLLFKVSDMLIQTNQQNNGKINRCMSINVHVLFVKINTKIREVLRGQTFIA